MEVHVSKVSVIASLGFLESFAKPMNATELIAKMAVFAIKGVANVHWGITGQLVNQRFKIA